MKTININSSLFLRQFWPRTLNTLRASVIPWRKRMWNTNKNAGNKSARPFSQSPRNFFFSAHEGLILCCDWSACNGRILSGGEDCRQVILCQALRIEGFKNTSELLTALSYRAGTAMQTVSFNYINIILIINVIGKKSLKSFPPCYSQPLTSPNGFSPPPPFLGQKWLETG